MSAPLAIRKPSVERRLSQQCKNIGRLAYLSMMMSSCQRTVLTQSKVRVKGRFASFSLCGSKECGSDIWSIHEGQRALYERGIYWDNRIMVQATPEN